MRNFILLAIFSVTILSCSNGDDTTDLKLLGQWNWTGSSGGIAGTTETPQTTGENRKLDISTDSIVFYLNGSADFKTKYTIEKRESLIFNEPREMIIQENGFRQIFELNENKLVLTGDCNDCITSTYVKE